MIRFMLIILVAFIAMEFVSYLAHRFVYHKLLWIFHKSHHSPRKGLFEWNDVFPLFFSSVSIVGMAYAVGSPDRQDLLAAIIGVTIYGITYLVIHDLYVHRRMKSLRFKNSYLQRVKKAHMIHHAFGGEPYGLLFFPLPPDLHKELEQPENTQEHQWSSR